MRGGRGTRSRPARGATVPGGYTIRPLSVSDAPALAAAYARNREYEGWDGEYPADFYTATGQAKDAMQWLRMQEQGLVAPYVIIGPDGQLAGRAHIHNIVRGTMHGGTLGYWIDKDHQRLGLDREALKFLEQQALRLGLHRLEAGILVDHVAPQRLLESCGYERYGLAPKLLHMGADWRDQVLFQKLLHARPLAMAPAALAPTG